MTTILYIFFFGTTREVTPLPGGDYTNNGDPAHYTAIGQQIHFTQGK